MNKIRQKALLILTFVLFLMILGLFWLGITVILFASIYGIVFHYISLIPFNFSRKIVKGFFLFVFLLSATICTKLLAFDIYKIPSSSMENLLYPGDVIVVNKLEYGPKLPRSPFEIPWVNLFFYMNKDARARMKESWWDYFRFGGTSTIKRGDVFVFNSTWSEDCILVKRCIGISGDTLRIKKGEIYTNSILFNSLETVKNKYSFHIKNKTIFYKIIDSLHIEGYMYYDYRKPNNRSGLFSKQEFEFLRNRNCIDSVNRNFDIIGSQKKILKNPTSEWTLDDMGPIVIPKKGMRIELNPDTFMIYEKAINVFEKCKLTEKKGTYFINGKMATGYTFKMNYYFMMGDNRNETFDSRYWGFLPETNIVGKGQCVLFSNKNEEFQWKRLLKML